METHVEDYHFDPEAFWTWQHLREIMKLQKKWRLFFSECACGSNVKRRLCLLLQRSQVETGQTLWISESSIILWDRGTLVTLGLFQLMIKYHQEAKRLITP